VSLTLYFDRNVGSKLPDALCVLGRPAYCQTTKKCKIGITGPAANAPLFDPETADDMWLADIGAKGWIVFSHDKKFHKPGFESEMSAIKQFNIGCFYLWGANAKAFDKARSFFRAYDRIIQAAISTPKPFIYEVQKSGRLKRIEIP